jgi:hypothetical protein
MNDDGIRIIGEQANDNDEGLTACGDAYLISDRELDQLAEAALAFARWERTRRWWQHGCIEDDGAITAA